MDGRPRLSVNSMVAARRERRVAHTLGASAAVESRCEDLEGEGAAKIHFAPARENLQKSSLSRASKAKTACPACW